MWEVKTAPTASARQAGVSLCRAMWPEGYKEEWHLGDQRGRTYLPSGSPSPVSCWSSFTSLGMNSPVLRGSSPSSSVVRSRPQDVVFSPILKEEKGPVPEVCRTRVIKQIAK